MFSKRSLILLKNSLKNNESLRVFQYACTRNLAGTAYESEDPAPLFINPEVQSLLKDLTKADLSKVFRKRTLGKICLEPPEYKFMTTEELEQSIEQSKERAQTFLQMPPVVKIKKDDITILSQDPALQGFDTSSYVFTDITFGVKDSDRLIVVRDTYGNLKHASIDVRKRINQTYFPSPGRKIVPAKMFQEQYFKSVLNNEHYEFILDKICLQFDPNDADFHKYTQLVYDHINDKKHYQSLRSTRHFGPMTFYLCWTNNIDDLLQDFIRANFIIDAVRLVSLFYKVKPDCKSNANNKDFIKTLAAVKESELNMKSYDECVKFVDDYINKDAVKRSQLQLALQAHAELFRQQLEVAEGIKAAHGLA